MGLFKQAIIFVVFLYITSRLSLFRKQDLPVVIDGYCHEDFIGVANIFRSSIEDGSEKGASIAVYYKGEKVVDMWAGYADIEAQRPWREDTISQAFSSTKGVAAIILAKMVQDGNLDYDKPVSYYWPEFAQNNKENITVRMLISHQAGLVLLDEPLFLNDFKDDMKKVHHVLASQKTAWPAGSQFGYHAITYGLYVDRLVQLSDSKGRDTEAYFQEEIAQPFGIDFHMNTPLKMYHRTARLYPRTKWQLLLDAFQYTRYLRAVYNMLFHPDSMMARCMDPVKEYSDGTNVLNNPYNRDITVSSASGAGTARGLAKLYGILATGGSHQGKQLLSTDLISKLAIPVALGKDIVLQTGELSRFGLGMIYRRNPWGEDTVGHSGHGGQVAHADLHNNLGIAYLTNHLTIHGAGDDPRFKALEEAIYKSISTLKQ